MVSVATFTKTGMASTDCWQLVVGSSVACIGEVVALYFGVTSGLMSTCLLFVVKNKKFMRVGQRRLLGAMSTW